MAKEPKTKNNKQGQLQSRRYRHTSTDPILTNLRIRHIQQSSHVAVLHMVPAPPAVLAKWSQVRRMEAPCDACCVVRCAGVVVV